jgi:queuine tRNA-ribosyltransferase
MSLRTAGAFALRAVSGRARRASLTLAHGVVETPAFMPVGTAATVKALAPRDLIELDARIVLSNTYHLWLRPGLKTIVELGGLHAFMAWDRPILTDSGGFQVFSLESRRSLGDNGVRFRSHIDGSQHEFTPENVVAFQEALGVDVAMALDVCVKLPAGSAEIDESVRLTSLWARRCAEARKNPATLLFGIVQGGDDERARARSAAGLFALDLPGYAIGGLSVGETRAEFERLTRFCAGLLPEGKPRYLMGVGTRCGRNGRALTRDGDLNIRNAAFARDPRPLDERCRCSVCATFSRGYLSHLFRAEEMLGPRLLSYHNLAVLLDLMAEARAAIEAGTWPSFRDGALAALDASAATAESD